MHVTSDPRVGADPRDLQEQTELLIRIRAAIADVMGALAVIERRRQHDEPSADAQDEVERALHRVVPPGDLSRNHPGGVLEGLQSIAPVVTSADAAPTRQSAAGVRPLAPAGADGLHTPWRDAARRLTARSFADGYFLRLRAAIASPTEPTPPMIANRPSAAGNVNVPSSPW